MGVSASGIDSSLTACTLAGLGLAVPECKTHAQQHEHDSLAQSSNLLLPKGHANTVLKAVLTHFDLHQSSEEILFRPQCLSMLAA